MTLIPAGGPTPVSKITGIGTRRVHRVFTLRGNQGLGGSPHVGS